MGDKCSHSLNSPLGDSGVAVSHCEKTEILGGLSGSSDILLDFRLNSYIRGERGLKTMLQHRVLFPIPYGIASRDFDVLCIPQLMLKHRLR
jgi:hypothetical protein